MENMFQVRPHASFGIERIIGVSGEGNVRAYQVQWAPSWINSTHLVGCERLIQEFISQQSEGVEVSKTPREELCVEAAGTTTEVSQQPLTYECNDNRPTEEVSPMKSDFEMENDRHNECEDSPNEESKTDCFQDMLVVVKTEEDANSVILYDEGMHENMENQHNKSEESSAFHNNNNNNNNNIGAGSSYNPPPPPRARRKVLFCPVCGKSCKQKTNLEKHMRIHTGQKPYACGQCDKRFNQKSHLNTHVKIHSGLKPFQCHICERAFAQSSHLNAHLLIHSGDKPHTCPVCNKSFTQKGSLNKHMQTQHQEVQDKQTVTQLENTANVDTVHKCFGCDKTFSSLTECTEHINCCVSNVTGAQM